MMPGIDPREARKRRVRIAVRLGLPIFLFVLTASRALLSGTRLRAWHWIPGILGITAFAVFTAVSMAASGYRPGGRRRGSGPSGRGRDNDGPAGAAPHQWHMLVMASLLMPRSAGRRWLAEAGSLLSEIEAARRGAAIRSYLLSAPRLTVMMWAREVLRRARLGPRRPG
jgi:hypothetical protein